MASPFASFSRLLKDPPPELVYEIAPDAVRMARVAEPLAIRVEPLSAGVLSPSPLHDNIASPEALNEAVGRLAPGPGGGKGRSAAILLPDHCAHVAVLDFDKLPDKADEQRSLIRFRLKRSVPFDVEAAALSYWIQAPTAKGRRDVVVAITAREIITRYEAPFLLAGLQPGFVSLAPLACMDLMDARGIAAIARLSGNVLSILVLQDSGLKVFRSIQLSELSAPEIIGHLHQTFVYAEDNLGSRVGELVLAGFGEFEAEALHDFPGEFGMPVGALGGPDTGIRGYLRGVVS